VTSLRRLLLLACALVLSAFGLAACGSDSGGGGATGSAQDILRTTFASGKPVKSGRLDAALNLNLQGLKGFSGPIALKLTGPFQSKGSKQLPAFDLNLALNTGGSSFTAGAVSTGEKGYLKLQNQTYDVGAQLYNAFKTGYEQATKDTGKQGGGASFKTLGIDPLRWLTNPRKAGEAKVGGTDTAHITARIDVGKLLDDVDTLLGKAGQLGVTGATAKDLPKGLSARTRTAIERSVKSASFDVYSGKDDGLLRRLVVRIAFDVPASVRKDAGGLSGGTAALDLTLSELNEDQTITAPKSARPLSDLTSVLGGLLGGGGSGSGSSGSGSTGGGGSGGGPAGGGSSSKYLSCIDAAGQDIAKVQKCAALIGK
jgi:hypothetical protein